MGIRKLILPLLATGIAAAGCVPYAPIKTYEMHPNIVTIAFAPVVSDIGLPDGRVLRYNSGYDGQEFELDGQRMNLPVGYELQVDENHRVRVDKIENEHQPSGKPGEFPYPVYKAMVTLLVNKLFLTR